ncbi:MAG: MFS transporter [Patescibacteria group bacterium]
MYNSNIWKIGLSVITNDSMFDIGVGVLFMLSLGLDLSQVSLAISVYLIFSIIGQIPSGILADKFGYKNALFWGAVVVLSGTVLYALAQNAAWFYAAFALKGFGASMKQGADYALLYEGLKKDGREKQYKQVAGKVDFGMNVAGVVASIMGGFLYVYNQRWPFYAEIILVVLGIIAIATLRQPTRRPVKISPGQQLKQSFDFAFRRAKFSKIFIFSALIGSVALITIQYAQPLYQQINISAGYFGLIGAAMFVLRGVGSLYSEKLGKIFSIDKYLVLHSVVFGLFLILIQKTNSILAVLLVFGIFFFLRGIYNPTVSAFINDKVKSGMRATILSINSQVLSVVTALGLLMTGYLADAYDLYTAFFGLSIMSSLIVMVYILVVRKVQVE